MRNCVEKADRIFVGIGRRSHRSGRDRRNGRSRRSGRSRERRALKPQRQPGALLRQRGEIVSAGGRGAFREQHPALIVERDLGDLVAGGARRGLNLDARIGNRTKI